MALAVLALGPGSVLAEPPESVCSTLWAGGQGGRVLGETSALGWRMWTGSGMSGTNGISGMSKWDVQDEWGKWKEWDEPLNGMSH